MTTERIKIEPQKNGSVKVSVGLTLSTGVQYEFIRHDVEVGMECEVNQISETYEKVSEQVSEMIDTEVNKYKDLMND